MELSLHDQQSRLVKRYYYFQFAFSMLFWLPIFFEFQKRLGLTEPEIFRIQSLYYIAFCVLEIPTGFFADRVGYLTSLRLGAIVMIASHLLAILPGGFAVQLWHWAMLALARSLVSGASSAYLYEFLRQKGLKEEYQRIEGRARAWTLYGRVGCFAVVGYLMQVNLRLPYYLTLGSAAFATYLAFRLPMIHEQGRTPGAKPQILKGLGILGRSPKLAFLMAQGVVLFTLGRIVSVNLFQPILEEKGIAAQHFGAWMAGLTLAEAFGSMTPDRIRKYGSLYSLTFALSFSVALCLVPAPYVGRVGITALLILFSVAVGWAFPIQKQLINDQIAAPEYRATFLSIESIVDRAACAAVAWILEIYVSTKAPGQYSEFFFRSGTVSITFLFVLMIAGYALRSKERNA